jgi:hypothetical protein
VRNPDFPHSFDVDEALGIYRGEVLAIMGALADVNANVLRILRYIEGEDDGEEEEEEDLPDA